MRQSVWIRRGAIVLLALLLGMLPLVFWLLISSQPVWQALPPASQSLELGRQATLAVSVYGIKLVYMLLTLAALALVWKERGPTWRALQGALAAFWLGEFFCAINILFLYEESPVFEYLHSLFMVFCVGLLFYSVMEAVDHDILHFSKPKSRCALVGVCTRCIKAEPESQAPCLLRRLFTWMMPLGSVLAFMPLQAQPMNYSLATQVFGLPKLLTHLMPIQWYELRFSPVAALILLAGSWLALTLRGYTPAGLQISKILLSAAAGQLGFTFMRLAFASFYREDLTWFVFWEELTELVLVVGVLAVISLTHSERLASLQAKLRERMAL